MKEQTKTLVMLFICCITLSACSSPVVKDVRYQGVSFDAANRVTKVEAIDSKVQTRIKELTAAIVALGPKIDHTEAAFVARESILFPMHLANDYKLVSPAQSQNRLVNSGQRSRGLCYHFASDMNKHIVKNRTFKTLNVRRAMSFQGNPYEHHVLAVSAIGDDIRNSIILDAWRESANLYWVKASRDSSYSWEEYERPKVKKSNTISQIL